MALSDWDFSWSGSKSLDPAWYKSSPTSLKITDTSSQYRCALHKNAAVQNLPQGQMISWHKRGVNAVSGFVFRNQQPSGSANLTNSYALFYNTTDWDFCAFVSGVYSHIAWMGGGGLSNGTEKRVKCIWWNGENLSGLDAIAVQIWIDNLDGTWTLISTAYDTNNRWKTSGTNRCGIFYQGAGGNYAWLDDTEIWIPTP